jgi:hypothetical protein
MRTLILETTLGLTGEIGRASIVAGSATVLLSATATMVTVQLPRAVWGQVNVVSGVVPTPRWSGNDHART